MRLVHCFLVLAALLAALPARAVASPMPNDGFTPAPDDALTLPLPTSPAPLARHRTRLPLHFVRNDGQTDPATRFEVRGRGYLLWLQPTEAVMVLDARADGDAERPRVRRPSAALESWSTGVVRAAEDRRTPKPVGDSLTPFHVLRTSLVGAYPDAVISGEDELPGKFHYFIGDDPTQWRTNVPSYAKVRYHEVYPGIDLVYYGNEGQLEYDFVVAPGANPGRIELAIEGADTAEIDSNGDLRLYVGSRELFWRKPVVFQEVAGARVPVEGEYVLKPSLTEGAAWTTHRVRFQVAPYDRALALVIDPVLAYSTFLGGGLGDSAQAIAVDTAGNAYVAGRTFSRVSYPIPGSPFPTTPGAIKATFSLIAAAFVTKVAATGDRMLYSTVLCGVSPSSQSSIASAIGVDALGQAVIAGGTDARDFPRKNALQPGFGGGSSDAFVAKLSPDGSTLLFSTFLGGTQEEGQGEGEERLALDADSNIYVAGQTRSSNFPTSNAVQAVHGGDFDLFLAKLDPNATKLLYSTYLGGTAAETRPALAVIPSGNAYVTGNRWDAGSREHVLLIHKLNATGNALDYLVTLGQALGKGLAADDHGAAYLTGDTLSEALPVSPGSFQPSPAGGGDAFIAKLHPTGSAWEYMTYLGGSLGDRANTLCVDPRGNAFVAGATESTDFPVRDAQRTQKGNPNPEVWTGFVCKLNPTGSQLVWSTYLGGTTLDHFWSFRDEVHAMARDARGALFIAGETCSPDFPVQYALQETFDTSAGFTEFDPGPDAFVTKLVEPETVAVAVQISRSGSAVAITWPVAAGFGLESADGLTNPQNWKPESVMPEIISDQNVVTLEIGIGPRFFRLRKP